MKFTVFSDLHGAVATIQQIPEQKDTILLLPGDVEEVQRFSKYRTMVEILTSKFKEVLMVPGNHEYYGSNITKTHRKLKELDDAIENFHFLQNDFRMFDNILILGGTLWTDFDGANPLTKIRAMTNMNDYRCIRHGSVQEYWNRKLNPEDVEFFHYVTKKYLQETLDKQREVCDNIKTVVMTHHAPSFQSVHEKYKDNDLNGCYCSNMDYFVESLDVDFWVHGHVHSSHDYMLGRTRVICNPFGYSYDEIIPENSSFDSTINFEV